MSMVTCKLCDAQFTGVNTQGWGCSSSVYEKDGEWFVLGSYGSRLFDMSLYKFVPATRPEHERWLPTPTEAMSPVCDVCITVWQRLKRLVLIEENVL